MNTRQLLGNARNGAVVAAAISAVFGVAFTITTAVASAAEDQQSAPANPSPEVRAQHEPPRPMGPPPRPSFKDFDTNGDGSISPAEFEAFRPGPPPPRPGEWSGDDRRREGPGRDARDDRPGAPEDGYGPPPPPHRPEGERYGRGDDRRGGDPCPCAERGGDPHRDEFGPPPGGPGHGPDERPAPPPPPNN